MFFYFLFYALSLTLCLSLFRMQLLQRGEARQGEAGRHLEVFISRTFTYPNCQRATRVLRLLIAVTLRRDEECESPLWGN